jgi:3-hydroxyacyl-[acyl-carrier-protein] dehydratase
MEEVREDRVCHWWWKRAIDRVGMLPLQGRLKGSTMRFLFYDRITALDKGKSIEGVKSFSLSEEYLRGHFRMRPVIPGVIYIEAMAQLLGWLITYSHDFKCSAIMSLIENGTFPPDLSPGFEATIRGEVLASTDRDTLGRARVELNGRPIATLDRIIYTHFQVRDPHSLRKQFGIYSGWDNSW